MDQVGEPAENEVAKVSKRSVKRAERLLRLEGVMRLRALGKTTREIAQALETTPDRVLALSALARKHYLARAAETEATRIEEELDRLIAQARRREDELEASKACVVKRTERVGRAITQEDGTQKLVIQRVKEVEYRPTPNGDPEIRRQLTEINRCVVVLLGGGRGAVARFVQRPDPELPGSVQGLLPPGRAILEIPQAPPPSYDGPPLEPIDAILTDAKGLGDPT